MTIPAMVEPDEVARRAASARRYLEETLLPFWIERAFDHEVGGFLTHFDAEGRPTGATTKSFLSQIRLLFAFSHAFRHGYGGPVCAELAQRAADFLLAHYRDLEHDGWIWMADREGRWLHDGKIGYGQCFGMYAFAEYQSATGDPRGEEAMAWTYDGIARHMIDTRFGGYFEIMDRVWRPLEGPRAGGDVKSFDVHMHMMEALTGVYAVTGSESHRRRLLEVIDLIVSRMLTPGTRLGRMQFARDFTPVPHRQFDVVWGKDEPPENGEARPLDTTSYGHNVEFAWLLGHAADVLGEPRSNYAGVVRPILEHCLRYGIDWESGGVFVEGPLDGPPRRQRKQFWQHAEVMVGMLDGVLEFGDERCWRAFCNVMDFVFERLVAWEGGGEWRLLVERDGTPVWGELGTDWKVCYHTVRGMVQVIARLECLEETLAGGSAAAGG